MNILLIDDHELVLQGLRSMLQAEEGISSILSVTSAREGLELIQKGTKVDVVLTDLQMPSMSGFELIESLRYQFPNIKIIVVSMLEESVVIQKALSLGVSGYVLKNEKKENLLTAIKTVAMGGQYTSPNIMRALLNKTQNSEMLSQREKEIAICIAEGRKNHEVAEQLNISPQTVATHRKNVYKKLNVSNTAALVKYVSQQGWI